MAEKDLLTLVELSREAGLSETTCRRYVSKFKGFIPSQSFGRHVKYQVEAVAVAWRISELYAAGRSSDQIYENLSREFQTIIEKEGSQAAESPQESSLALSGSATLGEVLKAIQRDYAGRLTALENENAELRERLARVEGRLQGGRLRDNVLAIVQRLEFWK